MATHTLEPRAPEHQKRLESRLDAMSWGAFFVWLGVTLLLEVDLAIGLYGVAAIVLVTQIIASRLHLRVEAFWIVIGICFLLGGVWEQFALAMPLFPILLIGVGLVMLVMHMRTHRHA
jgi:hypothetical protein